jgi:hypothetical protein
MDLMMNIDPTENPVPNDFGSPSDVVAIHVQNAKRSSQ